MLRGGYAYFRSPSARVGLLIGAILYLAYASSASQWENPWLILTTGLMGLSLPFYSSLSNRVDEAVSRRSSSETAGRMARFIVQVGFNALLITLLCAGSVIARKVLAPLGGIWGAAVLMTLTSQGVQYAALILAGRGVGTRDWNVLSGFAFTSMFGAMAAVGYKEVQSCFILTSLVFGVGLFTTGLLRDLSVLAVRQRLRARRG